MNSQYLTPRDNYERNFNMIKHFCSKSIMLLLIILMFLNIISNIYVMFASNGPFEIVLLNVAFSKFNITVDVGSYHTTCDLFNILANGFFTFNLLRIYIKSKNEDYGSSPESSIYMLYLLTMGVLVIYGLLFFLTFILIFIVIIANPDSLSIIPGILQMTSGELNEKKFSIVIAMVGIEIAILFVLWITQAQADFLKSVKSSLNDSVPKNKGAHTYGTFSIIIGVILLSYAAVTTFLYYCYRDAFSGLGYKISDIYVFISLVFVYIKGLIPIIIGVIAYLYSNIVDETKTHGTLYTDFGVIGEAVDPNSQRKSNSSSANKFIR